jgi:hypothetical protein
VALTKENVTKAGEVLAELELKTLQLEGGLANDRWDSVPQFSRAEDVYFDLFTMVEAQRSAFGEAGVAVGEYEQFGYASILSDQRVALPGAPESEEVRSYLNRMHRQKQTLIAVLDALRSPEVIELISVERSPLLPPSDDLPLGPDVFLPEVEYSLQSEGVVETYGVRLEFRGKTAALRDFLQKLSKSGRPVILRNIEIQRAGERRSAASAPRQVASSPFRSFARATPKAVEPEGPGGVPIVEANDSIFVVYLEGYYILPPLEQADGEVES